jgi:hypothetical protein
MKSGLVLPAYGAFGVLALLLVIEWLPAGEPAVRPPPVSHTQHSATAEADNTARDTTAWAAAILRRPLFTQGRKPYKTAGHLSQSTATGLPRLAGIMITGFGKRAIFMPEGGKPLTLGEGAAVDDYTIRRIAPDFVVLSGVKGEMTLHPAYDGSRVGQITPNPPMFGQPGFQQPGFNPGFTPPQIPPLNFQPPQPAANQANDDDNDGQPAAPAIQPGMPQFPGIRGPFIPRGRN